MADAENGREIAIERCCELNDERQLLMMFTPRKEREQ